MRRATQALLLGLALVGALACRDVATTPGETVERYLALLPRDPVRTLELLTPEFHLAHGLRFEEVGERPFADAEARRPTPSDDPTLEVERARLGWLTVLTRPIFALQSPRLSRGVRAEQVRGERAEVEVRIVDGGRPPLDARFQLTRAAPGAPWRIDAVALGEVGRRQLVAAYLTAPNATLHRRIAALRAERSPGPSAPGAEAPAPSAPGGPAAAARPRAGSR